MGAFSDSDALIFVDNYRDSPIKGNSGFTLQNYLNTHKPVQGVIINPMPGVDVLVWYDYGNKLHVIENVDPTFANNVAKPDYHTPDESFLYNLTQNTVAAVQGVGNWVAKIPDAIPDPKTITTVLAVAAGLYLLMILPKTR